MLRSRAHRNIEALCHGDDARWPAVVGHRSGAEAAQFVQIACLGHLLMGHLRPARRNDGCKEYERCKEEETGGE